MEENLRGVELGVYSYTVGWVVIVVVVVVFIGIFVSL